MRHGTGVHIRLAVLFDSVLRPCFEPVEDPLEIKFPPDQPILHTRQVFRSATTNEDGGKLLKCVLNSGDVAVDLSSLLQRQEHTNNFAGGGVGFFWGHCKNLLNDPLFLGIAFEIG